MKLTGKNWSLCISVYWSAIFEMPRFVVGRSYPIITFLSLEYVDDQKSVKIGFSSRLENILEVNFFT